MRFVSWLFCIFMCLASDAYSVFYYFIPPKNWDLISSDKLPSGTVIAFVEKSHKPVKASINLGIEKTTIALEDYVEKAKKKILANRSNTWTSLGTITKPSWKGYLSQIDSKNGCGDIRSLQCIISDSHQIYVLTGVGLKEDHIKNTPIFLDIFESFSIEKDSFSSIDDKQLKVAYTKDKEALVTVWQSFIKAYPKEALSEIFKNKEFQKKHWLPFEQKLQKNYKKFGLFWQAQAAHEIQLDLLSNNLKKT